jgi:hypothetical protein
LLNVSNNADSICSHSEAHIFVNFQRDMLPNNAQDKRSKLSCCMRVSREKLGVHIDDQYMSILDKQTVLHASFTPIHSITLNQALVQDMFLSISLCDQVKYCIQAASLTVPYLLRDMTIDTISVDYTNMFNERGDWAYHRLVMF